MGRKLATIREITEIIEIEGADFIELAKIGGWQCIVKKGEFTEGDIGVYFEIDSFLPEEGRYEFLRKSSYKLHASGNYGFRIKSMKLRGHLSQGLLLPYTSFPEFDDMEAEFDAIIEERRDITELLGVNLWEAPSKRGTWLAKVTPYNADPFPVHIIRKTDQERIQNLDDWYDKYKDLLWEETLKYDGTSLTAFFYKNEDGEKEFGVCSRNWQLPKEKHQDSIYWKIAVEHDLENLMSLYGRSIAIQGEIYGEGIAKNPHRIKGVHLAIFDIWDIDQQRYLFPNERHAVLDVHFGKLQKVLTLREQVKIFSEHANTENFLKYVENHNINNDFAKEGIVYKALVLEPKFKHNLSFKVVNNKFLLKEK